MCCARMKVYQPEAVMCYELQQDLLSRNNTNLESLLPRNSLYLFIFFSVIPVIKYSSDRTHRIIGLWSHPLLDFRYYGTSSGL